MTDNNTPLNETTQIEEKAPSSNTAEAADSEDHQTAQNETVDAGTIPPEADEGDKDTPDQSDTAQANVNPHSFNPETDATADNVLKDPSSILALANKTYSLPAPYVPNDLVEPNVDFPFTEQLPKRLLRQVAASALEELFAAAEADGIELFAISGYRSYDRQEAIFASNVTRYGSEEKANTVSAYPGESEHQTGLAMDVSAASVGNALVEELGEKPEGIWLEENAHRFGFIIRYQKDTQAITEYQYEPWHLRYVGKEPALAMFEQDITLEEYLGVYPPE
ncbi:M15 family metallopeptidase [Aureibacillus halotolerans]|uniref:D-Ala-D-Ala carboxypeptidase n=1 Tax=Aureibacillus halotolerans TaxID=1508390 RepID=A0A4R6UBG9_9BACI|nr:M15 family metallopeptidase [Aureibacillus halotolerans]TDQ42095.1 D-Ala-D-Ala carboxypeptidase [Aureibacillus halotolerans]